jgi:hypothetical protein
MKRYSVRNKLTGIITNSWTDDKLPADHYESGFGPPGSYDLLVEDLTGALQELERKKNVREGRDKRIRELAKKWKDTGSVTNAERDELVKHLVLDYVRDLD